MPRPDSNRRVALLLALASAFLVSLELSNWRMPEARRAVLSLNGWRGIPDCPPAAARNILGHQALECWFYGQRGAWRITSLVAAHHALVVEVEATGPDEVTGPARAIVEGAAGAGIGEVLVYVSPLSEPASADGRPAGRSVTRVRWTPRDGFATLSYQRASAHTEQAVRQDPDGRARQESEAREPGH